MHLLLALALSAFDPVFCDNWKITERDGKVSYSSKETIGGFLPDSHYVISAEMRAAEPGTVALGVDSWHGGYKRHYYKQVKLPVGQQWRTHEVHIATPSIREYPVFSNKTTKAVAYFGPKGFEMRNWKMRRKSARREIEVGAQYLELPVRNGGKPYKLTVRDGGRNAVEPVDVQLSENPHWWALMDVGGFKGRTLTLEAPWAAAEALKLVRQRDGIPPVDRTGDAFRPQFHYSPRRGWVNDPNGLTYADGEWRLFYQHNPYGACWGNMHWGYAVSRDLVNWREMPGNPLKPDGSGVMYSGCGVVDEDNVAGFGKGAHLLYYTATGKKMVQSLAYSRDGREYVKHSGNPLIGQFAPGNRDPKIFRHRGSGHWVMVLCGVQNERHAVFIFMSKDLKNWERASTFLSGDCTNHDDWMHECPGLEELAIEGESGTAWVMWGAGCDYTVGEFDGREFRAVETGLPGIVRSGKAKPYYAGQTYANVPGGRVVWQAWYRLPYGTVSPFAHCFSLPQELSLKRTAEGLRMVRRPARELAALRESSELALEEFEGELAEVEVSCTVAPAGRLKMRLRGVELEYDAAESALTFGGERLKWPAPDGKLALRIYLDRVGAEIFSGDGLSMAALPKIVPSPAARRLEKVSAEGVADFAARAWRIKSIWGEGGGGFWYTFGHERDCYRHLHVFGVAGPGLRVRGQDGDDSAFDREAGREAVLFGAAEAVREVADGEHAADDFRGAVGVVQGAGDREERVGVGEVSGDPAGHVGGGGGYGGGVQPKRQFANQGKLRETWREHDRN